MRLALAGIADKHCQQHAELDEHEGVASALAEAISPPSPAR
jgi:hypothetical protein